MPTEPSNWLLKRFSTGATTVSSPVDSLSDTERNGRSLPFTKARLPLTAYTGSIAMLSYHELSCTADAPDCSSHTHQ